MFASESRWSAVSRWLNCSKYEITGLAFSSIDPEYVYVQGVDYEVVCGRWRESKKIFSYRGDSNWLGFSKWFGLGTSMLEVSSLKPPAIESKGFAFWVELVAPGLPGAGYLSYVCSDRDVLGGWSDSGSIFVADIRAVNGLHLSNDLDVPAATSLF
ncbi:hypothetical protein H5410_023615 [Solanum commersonii]|uniref:Uncharacterized protein n=1 Tax=Solanum commersonii TaxID=4109 RepID=A0A9J5ZK44_SOLCO|nr:hypothetical protein H5410_023615 [Solanum commersonii]